MKLIPPAEIAARIMTLASEAEHELAIVSPYNSIENWPKMITALSQAAKRGVKICFVIREGETPKGFESLGVAPVKVPNLHAKIYMSEKAAIVTSMNMVKASDDKSLDIGHLVTEKQHLRELRRYVRTYILPADLSGAIEDLPANVETCQPVFTEYFNRCGFDTDSVSGAEFMAKRFRSSGFVECCGYVSNKKPLGPWLFFLKSGFLDRIVFHEDGAVDSTYKTAYDSKVSLYDLIWSTANIVGGLYSVDVAGLYFKSRVAIYTGDDKDRLYDYIEKHLEIKFPIKDHVIFEHLVEEAKWQLQGNKGRFPYRSPAV